MQGDTVQFRVWAPKARQVRLRLMRADGTTKDLPMIPSGNGEFELTINARARDRYFYLLDHDPLQIPDPVSRLLPNGVHGPTEVVDPLAFRWTDQNWRGLDFHDYIIYELHVGTFTPSGTFDGVIEKLDYLKDLGITAIELMPVGAFPGRRNWGYDGVSIYAVQESYGGPDGLKRLVNAAHEKGLAVLLDVVYNHLGNEGNYLGKFGPYFTSKHTTPWGDAINFDDRGSENVRRYFVENALYWVDEYHLDGLRLDAVHTIQDDSPTHILAEIRDAVREFESQSKRTICLVAETDENSPRYVQPRKQGGYGLDAIWSDDFHHALHALATGENEGYYQDFGRPEQLVRAINEGFAFQGEHFKFWGTTRGEPSVSMEPEAHVICIQNHDQVGNRALGERLTSLVSHAARKNLAALLLLAPQTPLIFMGQETDEPAPFQFFTDYGDPVLQKAVSEGRRKEFKDFSSFGNHFPDPQDPATFERSRLTWKLNPERRAILEWYKHLLQLRKTVYGRESRSARAILVDSDSIRLDIPADKPKISLTAFWTGEHEPKIEPVTPQQRGVKSDEVAARN